MISATNPQNFMRVTNWRICQIRHFVYIYVQLRNFFGDTVGRGLVSTTNYVIHFYDYCQAFENLILFLH